MDANPHQRNEISTEHGLNFNSCLNQLAYFHVSTGTLLPDIFHDLLEGVFPFETKLLLKYLIQTKQYFSLSDLNSAIENIELGHLDSCDRPSSISHHTLFLDSGHSLKQQGIILYIISWLHN